jgi:hypothetical protein
VRVSHASGDKVHALLTHVNLNDTLSCGDVSWTRSCRLATALSRPSESERERERERERESERDVY